MKSKKSLYSEILQVTILPILVLGIAITILCAFKFTGTVYNQVERELNDISLAVLNTYDIIYPGNYTIEEKDGVIEVYKGGKLISGDFEYLDCLKRDTGIDITVFCYNARVLTTLFEDGKRMVGTYADTAVENDVLKHQEVKFYKSVYLGNVEYFAHYRPIYNVDKKCIGMIFTGKPVKEVNLEIRNNILPLILIAAIIIGVLMLLYFHYTKTIIRIIKTLQEFMDDIAKGELYSELDEYILKRDDEIGLIGKSAVEMQKALKIYVDQDVLTKMNNRRCGERLLGKAVLEAAENGKNFTVAIGDIDWFKKVNDNYGHDCGDLVLQRVADILKQNMEDKGFAVRWGGEEFLLVFKEVSFDKVYDFLVEISEEIRSEKIIYNGNEISVTMTFGMSEGNGHLSENDIIKDADDKLYKGKRAGRDRIVK